MTIEIFKNTVLSRIQHSWRLQKYPAVCSTCRPGSKNGTQKASGFNNFPPKRLEQPLHHLFLLQRSRTLKIEWKKAQIETWMAVFKLTYYLIIKSVKKNTLMILVCCFKRSFVNIFRVRMQSTGGFKKKKNRWIGVMTAVRCCVFLSPRPPQEGAARGPPRAPCLAQFPVSIGDHSSSSKHRRAREGWRRAGLVASLGGSTPRFWLLP